MAICVSFYLLIMHLDPDLMVSVDAKHHVYLLDPDLSAVMTVLEWWSVLRCLVTDRNCRFSVGIICLACVTDVFAMTVVVSMARCYERAGVWRRWRVGVGMDMCEPNLCLCYKLVCAFLQAFFVVVFFVCF